MYAPPAVPEPCCTVITGMPAADSRARLRNSAPPCTKPSTRYFSRLAPALSTRWMKGSLHCNAISCTRRILSSPMAWIAPASMPESLATTMQRTPDTKPTPAIMPPPGTDEGAVMAPINAMLAGLAARDSAAILAQLRPDGGATVANEAPNGVRTVRHMSWTEFAASVKPGPEKYE